MAMEGVEGAIDQNKAGLLGAIAAQGAAGAQAYEAAAARQQSAHQGAVESIAQATGATSGMRGAPPALREQLVGQQNLLNNVYSMDAASAAGAYGGAMGAMSGYNGAYMDQARAAVPALRAQAQGKADIIRQELAAQAEERRMQLEQMRLDQQFAREQEGWAREDRAYELTMREQAEAELGGLSEDEFADFEAAVENRRATIIGEVGQDDPYGERVALFETVTSTQPTMAGALRQLRATLEAARQDDPSYTREQMQEDLRELGRQAYAFYNPLEGTPTDADFGERLEAKGFDPGSYLPEYADTRPISRAGAASGARYAGQARAYGSPRTGGGSRGTGSRGGRSNYAARNNNTKGLPGSLISDVARYTAASVANRRRGAG